MRERCDAANNSLFILRSTRARSQGNRPKRLSVLCKYVIKKYKLSESKKKIEEPASITTIGGKTLRDRQKIAAETASSTASTSKPPPKKRKVNKCQDDVELIRKGKQKDVPSKRLPKNDVDTEKKSRSREEFFPEIPVTTEFPIRIKEEPEPATHVNQDPLGPDDEDYTVIVKEEFEADEETRLVSQHTATSHTSEMKVKVPTLVRSQNVAPSSSGPPLMTVVADDIQLFANNVAEQLRTFPLNRALLLQLEIQTMIDNERQLLLH